MKGIKTIVAFAFICQLTICHAADKATLDYQVLEQENQRIYILDIDPTQFKIVAVKAEQKTPVSKLVADQSGLAGINGGFFEEDGSPSGPLKINNKWYGLVKKPRAAIGWQENGQQVLLDRIITKEEKTGIVVQPQFNKTIASKNAWQNFNYIVGGIPLLIKNGKPIRSHSSDKPASDFIEDKHARTAICIKENNHWLFVVASHVKTTARPFVDTVVEGLTIPELQKILQAQGCKSAINLDGGGSSTLVVGDKVVNPYAGDFNELTQDYSERPVGDAIVILSR